jgi:hypothetical protein
MVEADAKLVMDKNQKVFFVGEFGIMNFGFLSRIVDHVQTWKSPKDNRIAGGLLWSLRFRSSNGGYCTFIRHVTDI